MARVVREAVVGMDQAATARAGKGRVAREAVAASGRALVLAQVVVREAAAAMARVAKGQVATVAWWFVPKHSKPKSRP
jgi:hypothetical protein